MTLRTILLALLLAGSALSARAQERWVILEGYEEGRPLVVSAREKMPAAAVQRALPWVVVIEWRYAVSGNGMPGRELLNEMYAFQDDLARELVAQELSYLAMTRTGNGLRAWTYYAATQRVGEERIAALGRARAPAAITVTVRAEPEWATLQEMIESLGPKPR